MTHADGERRQVPELVERLRKFPLFISRDGGVHWIKTNGIDGLCLEAADALEALSQSKEWVAVPRDPTEGMLRAALDARYCRSARARKVKAMFPDGYETWLKIGLSEDAPDIAGEYRAMLSAAPDLPPPSTQQEPTHEAD